MPLLRFLEIGVAIGGPLPVIDSYTDVSRAMAGIIPNWPLERLAVGSMRSEMICTLLGGARTKSVHNLELCSQLEPVGQPANGFTNIVSSLHSLVSLKKVVFLSDELRKVDPSAKAWSPVIRWANIKHLCVSRKLFDVFRLPPGGVGVLRSCGFPPNLIDLELHCGHHRTTPHWDNDRSPLKKWFIKFAKALERQESLGNHNHIRIVTLLFGPARREENFDFGDLMDVCRPLRIRLNCVDLDTGVAYMIRRRSAA